MSFLRLARANITAWQRLMSYSPVRCFTMRLRRSFSFSSTVSVGVSSVLCLISTVFSWADSFCRRMGNQWFLSESMRVCSSLRTLSKNLNTNAMLLLSLSADSISRLKWRSMFGNWNFR